MRLAILTLRGGARRDKGKMDNLLLAVPCMFVGMCDKQTTVMSLKEQAIMNKK